MTCECHKVVDEKLAERNTRLVYPLILSEPNKIRLMIETEQVERGRGKQKAVSMFAIYCPFCGAKY